MRMFPNVEGQRLQDRGAFDARLAERRIGTRLGAVYRILREPRFPTGRIENLPDFGDQRHGFVRVVAHGTLQELPASSARRSDRAHPGSDSAVDSRLSSTERHSYAVGVERCGARKFA